jgi:hypothetical protein
VKLAILKPYSDAAMTSILGAASVETGRGSIPASGFARTQAASAGSPPETTAILERIRVLPKSKLLPIRVRETVVAVQTWRKTKNPDERDHSFP